MPTTAEELKNAVRERLTAFNEGDLDRFESYIAPEGTSYFPGSPPLSREEFLGQISGFRSAFPDLSMTVESQIAEGDTVVTVWTGRGTHQGEMQGLAPTGKTVSLEGVSIDRFQDAAVIEHHEYFDQLGMMQQLGVAPSS